MKCTLLRDNVYCRLVCDDAEVVRLVSERLAVQVKGARYTKWFRSGRWDGRHRFLERPSNRFLSGLLPLVRRTLDEGGVMGVEEIDARTCPRRLADFPSWQGPSLRPYQRQAVSAAAKAGHGIVQMGTGGGKTLVAGRLLADLKVPALFLVHRKELATQALARFGEWLSPGAVGMIGADRWEERSVTVAMVQTLHARLKADAKPVRAFLSTRGAVVSDECHRAVSDTWQRILRWTPAYYRYGLSGTPLVRDDVRDLTLIGLTGEGIVDVSAASLATEGWLAEAVCSFVPIGEEDGPFERLGYQAAYDRLIVHDAERNRAAYALHMAHERNQVLFIVKRIEHGQILSDLLDIPFVSGRGSDDDRASIYNDFRSGELRHLIASTIYDEGVDFPALDVVVNLA